MATHMRRATGPTSDATRSFISPAALLVNVMARIWNGDTLRSATRYAIRCVSTRVLPEPAPATTRSGPSGAITASCWTGLRPPRRSSYGVVAASGAIRRSVQVFGCETPPMRVGVDTGGTFTDLVADDGRIVKVPSTPGRPGGARCTSAIDDARRRPSVELLAHGTTVATNALLEGTRRTRRARHNAGFADVIEIARQDRPSLYDMWPTGPEPLVPAAAAARGGRPARRGRGRELEPRSTPRRCRRIPDEVGRGGGVPAARRPGPGPRAGRRRVLRRPTGST